MTKTTHRLFIGIKVTADDIGAWQRAQIQIKKQLKNLDYDCKWTPIENYHVTLNFLGDTTEDVIPNLIELIDKTASEFPCFNLDISGVGAFNDLFHARVLYLGVQNKKILRHLQQTLASQIYRPESEGLSEGSDYVPHLTFLRFRNHHAVKDLVSPFIRKKWGTIQVAEIVLFESFIQGHYPIYKTLHRSPLTGFKEDQNKSNLD